MTRTDSETDARTPTLREISAEEFDQFVLASHCPVIVDFFATWCGPCAWILPTLERIEEDPGLQVAVVKLDVDRAEELAERYRIGSVPTVLLFRDGEEVERSVGVEPARVWAMATNASSE